MAGLTSTGFVKKTLQEIREDLQAALRAAFGDDINLDADSVFGRLVDNFAKPLADVWEALEAVYHSQYPSTAEGVALDNACELVGITRLPATYSKTKVICYGDSGVVISAGSKVAVVDTEEQFALDTDLTIDPNSAVYAKIEVKSAVEGETYTITINGTDHNYIAVAADTEATIASQLVNLINTGAQKDVVSASSSDAVIEVAGDPDSEGYPQVFSVAVNGTAPNIIELVEVGSMVAATAVNAGDIQAPAHTITEIVNPVYGWNRVDNPLDAVRGRDTETDTELRQRRLQSLQLPGAGTVGAIYAHLAQLEGVESVKVVENPTDTTDAEGRPPHSFEAVIQGGDDNTIAETIWQYKPAGIQTYGSTSVIITDSQGYDHEVKFSRPTEKLIWVQVTVTKYTEEDFPSDGADRIEQIILDEAAKLGVGNDVIPQRFFGPIYSQVPGIAKLDFQVALDSGGAPGTWQTDPIPIGDREIAVFDSTRITVTVA